MSGSFWRLLGIALVALSCGACSEPAEVESASKPMLSVFKADSGGSESVVDRNDYADSELPEILDVKFEPERPIGGERLKVVPRVAGGVTSIRYEWQRNGVRIGNNAAEIALPMLSKGDEILVRMTPVRGVIEGATFETARRVENQRPIITGLQIERVDASDDDDEDEEAGAVERWRVVARVGGSDDEEDQDAFEFDFRWFVNGLEVDEGEDTIALVGLHRGDTIAVHVTANDGLVTSPVVKSGEIVIGNSAPEIDSTPPSIGPLGGFRYVVRASDGDSGDRLEYSLRKSPRGMRISEGEGILTWQPDEDQAGRHEVEVVVTDGNGGEASQSFVLSLVSKTTDVPAAIR